MNKARKSEAKFRLMPIQKNHMTNVNEIIQLGPSEGLKAKL